MKSMLNGLSWCPKQGGMSFTGVGRPTTYPVVRSVVGFGCCSGGLRVGPGFSV